MLLPDFFYESVLEIPYQQLHSSGIRGLIFDIDNTLIHFDDAVPRPDVERLLARLGSMGFAVCLLTNNTNKRLGYFNQIGLPGIANALKPFARGLRRAMKKIGTGPKNTAIIGDQLLSDVWAGKRARCTTILVRPLSTRDFWFVHVKRALERRMLRGHAPWA